MITVLFIPGRCPAQIQVTDMSIANGKVRMEVADSGSGATDYRVLSSTGLEQWPKDFGADIEEVGTGRYVVTVPMDSSVRFFRIIGLALGSGVDPDGDGLPTEYETAQGIRGPDPVLFDTDDDGYNDGRELALGTDPADPGSFPELDGLPAVEFAEPNSAFTEGEASTHQVGLRVDPPYTGTVYYTVNARSTAAAPSDHAGLSGSVFVSGTSATIDIAFVDNQVISRGRILVLDLDPDPPGGAYRLGGRSTHLVNLSDNDCYWNGSLKDDLTERSFRLRILRQSGQPTRIAWVAGAADGLPEIDAGTSSQSTGIIPSSPQDVWQATEVTDTASRFRAVSPAMPVSPARFSGSAGVVSITSETLTRVISLDADPSANPNLHHIEADSRIVGEYTERITPADAAKTFLSRSTSGSFGLVKDASPPLEVDSPFEPKD